MTQRVASFFKLSLHLTSRRTPSPCGPPHFTVSLWSSCFPDHFFPVSLAGSSSSFPLEQSPKRSLLPPSLLQLSELTPWIISSALVGADTSTCYRARVLSLSNFSLIQETWDSVSQPRKGPQTHLAAQTKLWSFRGPFVPQIYLDNESAQLHVKNTPDSDHVPLLQCCCCSVSQSCLTLGHPVHCSTPVLTIPNSPRVCPSSWSLHRWCHPVISSSDALARWYMALNPGRPHNPERTSSMVSHSHSRDWKLNAAGEPSPCATARESMRQDSWAHVPQRGTFPPPHKDARASQLRAHMQQWRPSTAK